MALDKFSAEEWKQVDEELDRLLDLPLAEREVALRTITAKDEKLAAGLRHILANSDSPLDRPAVEMMADLVEADTGLTSDPAVGTQIGPFRIISQLGVGGMGVVYLAERVDGHFEQKVALKVVREGVRDEATKRRFLTERQILAELEHPHIARLIDGGVSDDGRPYLAMEYVDGITLDDFCEKKGLEVDQRVALFLDVCAAVEAAHHRLIVHRDLKSSNIMVDESGAVKVLDFGIAKWLDEERSAQFGSLTLNNAAPLTPDSSAPEQLQGGPISTATDVYALGVLLFRLLTGRRPFELDGLALTERIRRLTEEEARLASEVAEPAHSKNLRGDLDHIVAKAMRKDPVRRYASARELADDLERYLSGNPVLARPDSTSYRLGKFVRRNLAVVTMTGLVVLALVGGLIAATWQAKIAGQERIEAIQQAALADRISESLVRVFEDSNPYSGLGRVPTVLDLLDANVDRMRLEFTDEPELRAKLLLMMARAYSGLGHLARVEELYLEVEAARDSIFGPESYESAYVRLQRAALLRGRGDLVSAQELMPGILAVYERTTPPASTARVNAYEMATSLATAARQYSVADSLSLIVLDLRLQLFDEEDVALAISYSHRAGIVHELGRSEEAIEYFDRAIKIFKNDPNEQQNLSSTLGNYAAVLKALGRFNEAALAQLEAIETVRNLGMDSGDLLANQLNTYCMILNDLGRYDESIPRLREAAVMIEEASGKGGIRWLAIAMTLGTALTYENTFAEAATWLDAAVSGMGELVGTQHLYYGVALSYRGILDRRTGRLGEARTRFAQSLELLVPALPTRARNTVMVLTEMGEIELIEGRLEKAQSHLSEAVRLANESLPGNDPVRALAAAGLGEARCRAGDSKEARLLLRGAVATLTEVRGVDAEWTQLAAERMASCSDEH